MIGKHNTGGFKVPEEPPVWPASDLDEDEISIIGKIIKVCKEQYGLKNIFPYFFVINPGKPYWQAKVSAQNEFNEAVILDFSYDGKNVTVWNKNQAPNNQYSIGAELNDR